MKNRSKSSSTVDVSADQFFYHSYSPLEDIPLDRTLAVKPTIISHRDVLLGVRNGLVIGIVVITLFSFLGAALFG